MRGLQQALLQAVCRQIARSSVTNIDSASRTPICCRCPRRRRPRVHTAPPAASAPRLRHCAEGYGGDRQAECGSGTPLYAGMRVARPVQWCERGRRRRSTGAPCRQRYFRRLRACAQRYRGCLQTDILPPHLQPAAVVVHHSSAAAQRRIFVHKIWRCEKRQQRNGCPRGK